jgi:hypothetical protein
MLQCLDPFRCLLICLAGWMNQRQLNALEYLRKENRWLRGHLGGKRLRLNDAQRHRMGASLTELRYPLSQRAKSPGPGESNDQTRACPSRQPRRGPTDRAPRRKAEPLRPSRCLIPRRCHRRHAGSSQERLKRQRSTHRVHDFWRLLGDSRGFQGTRRLKFRSFGVGCHHGWGGRVIAPHAVKFSRNQTPPALVTERTSRAVSPKP